ncbi:MAG: TonB-dependent receptor [Bacteroidales bacterium]|nr:TonB-dependent receptor [Bacteroidales bacterium]
MSISSKCLSVLAAMLLSLPLGAQTKVIKGTVTDSDGFPVIAAGVKILEVRDAVTVTGQDGQYTLTLSGEQAREAKTIEFSFLGMETVTKPVPPTSGTVDALLLPDTELLQETVVIGYGSVRKRDLTGSVVNVTEKQFNRGVVTSATDMIAGQVAGLVVTKVGGDPTTEATMRLRGTTSLLGGNGPLVVIDGVPGASFNLVAPEDIESISVLKDASAAAIYGARSANGVIIISTKKGSEGNTTVTYNGYFAAEKAEKLLDMMTADDWRAYVAENNITSAIDYGASTDWQKVVTRIGTSQSHSVSLSGGSGKSQYRASITFLDRKGIMKENDIKRFNTDVSFVQKAVDDRLTVNFSFMGAYEDWKDLSYNGDIWSYVYNLNPTVPVYNPDGTYFQLFTYMNYNPLSEMEQVQMDKSRHYSQGRLAVDFKFLPWLSAGVSGALSRNNFISGYYTPSTAETGYATGGLGNRTTSVSNMSLLEANITADKLIGKHHISAILGYSWQKYIDENFQGTNREFTTDAFTYNNLQTGNDLQDGDVGSYKASSKLISFYGRVNYDYESRYLFTGTLRSDGSSKFGKNNRWGLFPSASVAWRISSEEFMKGISWVDDLKLRVSYGVTGNQDIGNYRTLAIYGPWGYYFDNGKFYPQYAPTQNPNPDLRWERTAQLDLGLDYSVFDGRLRGAIEYYEKRTTDLLYDYDVPVPPYQYSSMTANVGEVSNKGFEITIAGTPVLTRDFRWDASFNFARNRNVLVSLSNENFQRDKVYLGSYSIRGLAETTVILEEGLPLGTFYGAKCLGIDEDGILLYEDVNGDGKFVYADDRTYIGCAQPDFTANFSSQFSWKNWFASFLLRGVFGNDVINGTALYLSDISRYPGENVLRSALKKTPQTMVYSSYYVEDGSFVRVDNVQLGYDFKFKPTVPIRKMRISLTANNLFNFTRYSGIDPEVSQSGLVFGIDARDYYPKTRSVSLGMSITF